MIPTLKKQGRGAVLLVHGKPFLMLAGEVHNSNASTVESMEGVWQQAEALGLNTLLLPVAWEQLEPEEGRFDFTLVDGLIDQARRRGKHLVLLWFGSWKNGECMYAPAWVKTDLQRFRRAQIVKGKNKAPRASMYGIPYTSLSYLCTATRDADAAAFAALMAHLRAIDGEENTVLAVQVENETGLLGTARERSDEADAAFAAPVPTELIGYLRAHTGTMVEDVREAVAGGAEAGSWAEVFGPAAEEVFSAYHVACYVETVAAAGKAVYPLPMTANCWLDKGGEPGTYPSGGPVSRMAEVWDFAAPSIDIHTPDIYVPNFCEVCDEYTRRGTPLFIPETATHSYAGPRLVYAIGHYHALCCAPFGFEDMGKPFTATQGYLFGMDVTDPALKTPQDVGEYRQLCELLESIAPLLTERYGTGDLQAVCYERKEETTMNFGGFAVMAATDHPMIPQKDGVCLALKTGADSCILLGSRCGIMLVSTDPDKPNLDLLLAEEGRFVDGVWQTARRLNGDESAFMKFDAPTMVRLKVFAYA